MDKRYYEVYDPNKKNKPKPHLTWGGFANITIFIVGIAVIGVLSIVLPKPETSEFEGRRLAERPKLTVQSFFSGEFMEKFDLYYADTFPFRDTLVDAAAQYEDMKGFNADDVTIHGKAPVIKDDYDDTSSTSAEPTEDTSSGMQSESSQPAESEASGYVEESTPPEPGAIELDGEMKEGVFVVGNRAMSLFGTDPAFGKRYANVISSYRKRFGDDVTIYNLVIPTQSEFKLPEKYKKLSASQKKSIDNIYANLDPTIKAVDAYSAMERHKSEYLYFRTDHHWTPLGAYYAYTAFCETAGFTPVRLSEMEKKTKTDFLGSLYRTTQDPRLKNEPDYMDYYKVPVETKSTVYFPVSATLQHLPSFMPSTQRA